MQKTLQEFASELLKWYVRYMEHNEYAWGYIELMDRLPQKAKKCEHLDREDLMAIALWGGNQRNIKKRMADAGDNTPKAVKFKTRKAYLCADDRQAIEAITGLSEWGVSYGSKTLMFMNPLRYGTLDKQWMCHCLGLSHTKQGFVELLARLRKLQGLVRVPGLGPDGEWRIADIQQALFQYAQDGGKIR